MTNPVDSLRHANARPIVCIDQGPESEILRKPAEPVKRINRSIQQLLDDMLKTMYTERGVGLAAPQIGVGKRVIVVDVGDGPVELINPELTRAEGAVVGTEGCLSIPGVLGEVERAERVQVTGLDRNGRKIWIEAEGWFARALQHEIDHLDGVLFTDKAQRLFEVPPEKRLRIVYMGTPEFSAQVLERLLRQGFQVYAVVTQPDRPRGRGQKPQPSPVKRVAEDYMIETLQPERLSDEATLARLREFRPDVLLTCAYGKILPKTYLQLPKYAALNVHASLLPAYRGAAPIQRALLDGATETGISLMYMSEGMDEGDILLQRAIPIGEDETFGSVHDRLIELAAEMLPEGLRLLATESNPPRIPQDHARATYAPRIDKAETVIDWRQPAEAIVNRIRAFDPAPGAQVSWQGRALKVFAATVVEASDEHGRPGEIIAAGDDGVVVAAGTGSVRIGELQPPGRRRMTAAAFLNGYPLAAGQFFD